jgi:hypothetical protein
MRTIPARTIRLWMVGSTATVDDIRSDQELKSEQDRAAEVRAERRYQCVSRRGACCHPKQENGECPEGACHNDGSADDLHHASDEVNLVCFSQ